MLIWTIHSRNERSTTYSGRHFFAGRCCDLEWFVDEVDQPEPVGSRAIQRLPGRHATRALTAAVADFTTTTATTP